MISLDDQKVIEDAIAKVEASTSGELIVVTVNKSSQYKSANFRLGLLFGVLVVFIPLTKNFGHDLLFFQIPLFILGYSLGFIPKIKSFFLSKMEKDVEVYQRAMQAFFENNLHTTSERTGVLIFASLLERQVIILADTGINEKVEKGTWQKIMDDLIGNIKKKNLISGLQEAIFHVGDILSKHFPPTEKNPNELSNRPSFLKK
jgi:putative membrane protein